MVSYINPKNGVTIGEWLSQHGQLLCEIRSNKYNQTAIKRRITIPTYQSVADGECIPVVLVMFNNHFMAAGIANCEYTYELLTDTIVDTRPRWIYKVKLADILHEHPELKNLKREVQ